MDKKKPLEEKAFTLSGITEWLSAKAKTDEDMYYAGAIAGTYLAYERLQGENTEIKKWYDAQSKLYNNLQEESQEQKAEIERLTEKSSSQRLELCKEIAVLKKQVDEWTNTASKWFKRELELMDEVERAKGKSVKDAAQEALEAFICRLVNLRLVSTKGDLYVEMLELKDDLLKEKYGVEDKL